jgi:hypothetical protein
MWPKKSGTKIANSLLQSSELFEDFEMTATGDSLILNC